MRCTSEHPQLLTATHRTTPTKAAPRGYALIMCMIFGVLLASLTAAMLWSAGRDTAEARVQENAVRALYAAEAAAATGIEQLRLRMVTTPTPVITGITAPTLPGVQFPVFLINYIDSQTLAVKATPDTKLSLIENGPNSGLVAQQTPIQVLVSADVGGSRATISNAINAQQIPVFQFALFYNGDMELLNPGDFTVKGRVHANGDIHIAAPPRGLSVRFETTGMSSGTGHLFRCSIHNPTAFCTSKGGQPASDVRIFDGIQPIATPGTWPTLEKGFEDNLTETAQRDYLTANFKGVVVDKSILTHPIRVPIQLPASTVLPTIASRPDFCPGNDPETSATGVSAAFPQSAEAVIVKRPVGAYGSGNYPAGNPLAAWDSNYGPVPGLGSGTAAPCVAGALGSARCQALAGNRSVPLMQQAYADDDVGARDERMYWKADIRIVDGIWYRKGEKEPVFDPENWDMKGLAATDPKVVLGYSFARVLRYSWFWDPREDRVFTSSPRFQRGEQMRVTDVDVAAFNELLAKPEALTLLFPAGIPAEGIVLYVSETFDPTFEDSNASSVTNPTVAHANVRNFLDFHVMDDSQELTAADGAGAAKNPLRNSGLTPAELGWHPAFLWGSQAPTGFRSLTPSPSQEFLRDPLMDVNTSTVGARLGNQSPIAPGSIVSPGAASWQCQEPFELTTPSYANPAPPPCIQSGATPLGPENAIRVVRAQQMGCNGFVGCATVAQAGLGLTIATDNRMYVYGDVNVVDAPFGACTTSPCQLIQGKTSFIADSLTVLSQRFSDRIMQRGGPASLPGKIEVRPRFSSTDGERVAVGANTPYIDEQGTPVDDGFAPNMCSLLRDDVTGPTRPRKAVSTTINASFISGDVPSCANASTDPEPYGQDGNTSGGLANLPRFIEDWTGMSSIIHGSQVSLFRSEQGNSRFRLSFVGNSNYDPTLWKAQRMNTAYFANSANKNSRTACVYSAPLRRWSFDDTLLDTTQNNLPPGTPRVFAVERLRWIRR